MEVAVCLQTKASTIKIHFTLNLVSMAWLGLGRKEPRWQLPYGVLGISEEFAKAASSDFLPSATSKQYPRTFLLDRAGHVAHPSSILRGNDASPILTRDRRHLGGPFSSKISLHRV